MLMTSPICADAQPVKVHRNQSGSALKGGISSTMRLETDSGWKRASDIAAGDQVLTLDHGLRTVWNVRRKRLNARRDALPLIITAGAAGNSREFLIPEQQVVMVESDQVEQLTGSRFGLVCASDLIGYKGITKIVPPREFEVISLEFQNDEVVCAANGSLLLCAKPDKTDYSDDETLQDPSYDVLSSELAAALVSNEKSNRAFQMSLWNNGRDVILGRRFADER